jgi:U3 small nucleolar RNA-associated protein 12
MEKCGTILNSQNLFSLIPLQLSKAIHPVSTLPLASPYRVSQISFHPTLPYLFVQSNERSVEVFRVRSDDDIRKKRARRKKRADAKAAVGKGEKVNDVPDNGDAEKVEVVDLFTPYLIVRATGKIKSFALPEETRTKSATQVRYHNMILRLASYIRLSQIFFALSNNALEVYNVPEYTKSKETPPESARLYSLDLPGHRTDVRTLSLSSDDTILASASNGEWHRLTVGDATNRRLGSLKIWNTQTTSCIRTLECGHSVCSTFLPGDQYVRFVVMLWLAGSHNSAQVVTGTKSGEMQIFDLSSSTLVETIQAHTGTLWSMHVRPDQQALVTGGADKDIKFWNIEWQQSDNESVSYPLHCDLVSSERCMTF